MSCQTEAHINSVADCLRLGGTRASCGATPLAPCEPWSFEGECLTTEEYETVGYCQDYGVDGPDAAMNADCYLYGIHPERAAIAQLPECGAATQSARTVQIMLVGTIGLLGLYLFVASR